jgi:hypothetical protein
MNKQSHLHHLPRSGDIQVSLGPGGPGLDVGGDVHDRAVAPSRIRGRQDTHKRQGNVRSASNGRSQASHRGLRGRCVEALPAQMTEALRPPNEAAASVTTRRTPSSSDTSAGTQLHRSAIVNEPFDDTCTEFGGRPRHEGAKRSSPCTASMPSVQDPRETYWVASTAVFG